MTEKSNETGTLGMLRNDKNPVVKNAGIENPATQSSEAPANAKKIKKKQKKSGEGKDNKPKETKSTTEGTSKQESTELTHDEQLSRELDWCIEQLELGLRTQKISSKQREEASRALKTLHSSKAPLVKKRQVMRAISGDYRKKMEEERARQFKLIQSTMSSAQVSAVSEVKSVFHRRAERNTESTDKTDRGPQETNEHTAMAEKSQQRMLELSDDASSESDPLGSSLSVWLADGGDALIGPEELNVPLDLHTASSIGQYDVVAQCIRRGDVDLDGKNIGGWTPLMYAAYIGHDNIVNLLLETGVSVNVTTSKGLTPLMLAASCGNESIASFLLQQGAQLECKDVRGWTALLHSTATGHQQMVKCLLDNNANANVKEPISGFTPLMEAAASGHEIIVQSLLNHGVRTEDRNSEGETARALAMMYGHSKVTSLIDMHVMRVKSSSYEDLSSSEEESSTPRVRSARNRTRGASIHDGPQAIARFRVGSKHEVPLSPPGYVTFRDVRDQSDGICNRDVTSPINELDGQSNSSRDELFFDNDMPTMRSSSSSSEGLSNLLGLSREASLESNEDSDQAKRSCVRRTNKLQHSKSRSSYGNSGSVAQCSSAYCEEPSTTSGHHPSYTGPKDLSEFLEQIGFSKYLPLLKEQDIDLRIFLTLTENDLKEVGVTLFGPKRKMTSAIARWHSNARPPSDALEQAYADQLEAEMQEMAIQLHKRCVEVESLQAQVSQEKELRAVMEGCLMEEKMAWKNVQAELQEKAKHVQTLNGKLHALCNAHTQLTQVIREDEHSVAKGDEVMCAQLLSKMDSYMGELADSLKEIFQNLQSLSSPEKNSHNWEES